MFQTGMLGATYIVIFNEPRLDWAQFIDSTRLGWAVSWKTVTNASHCLSVHYLG